MTSPLQVCLWQLLWCQRMALQELSSTNYAARLWLCLLLGDAEPAGCLPCSSCSRTFMFWRSRRCCFSFCLTPTAASCSLARAALFLSAAVFFPFCLAGACPPDASRSSSASPSSSSSHASSCRRRHRQAHDCDHSIAASCCVRAHSTYSSAWKANCKLA